MKKVLVTGVNGMLGQNIVREFAKQYEIHGFDLNFTSADVEHEFIPHVVDITSSAILKQKVDSIRPDYIIHCAAYTVVDGAEVNADLAYAVNSTAVETICEIASRLDIPLIHISTDYVFDGTNGPYSEDAPCNPEGVYAKSKYDGEKHVTESSGPWAVIRPNVLYGHGKNIKSSFVAWLVHELREGRHVRIVDDQYNNPSYARRLAAVIRTLLEKNAWGVWHFGSRDVVSRYVFSLKIADEFNLDSSLIQPISSHELNQKAPRPLRSGLICEKIRSKLSIPILSISEELALLKEEMDVA